MPFKKIGEIIVLQNLTRRALFAAFALLTALPVAQAATDQTIRVGIMSAEDEDIWAVVAKEAAKQGLTLKLTVFNDYTSRTRRWRTASSMRTPSSTNPISTTRSDPRLSHRAGGLHRGLADRALFAQV